MRIITSAAINKSPSGEAVWDKVLTSTLPKKRISKKVAEIAAASDFATVQTTTGPLDCAIIRVKARNIKRQIIRITTGLLYKLHPSVITKNLEWEVQKLDQFSFKKSIATIQGHFKENCIGNGAYRFWHGIANDRKTSGVWLHVFHDSVAFLLTHDLRVPRYRRHAGIPLKSLTEIAIAKKLEPTQLTAEN